MSWEDVTEGGGRTGRLGKNLLHGDTGGVVVWGGDLGFVCDNGAEARGSSCGFLRQVAKLKTKSMKDGLWQKVATEKVLTGAGTQPLHTYLEIRRVTVAEWVAYQLFSRYAQGKQVTRERGSSGSRGIQAKVDKQLRVMLGYIS